MNTQINIDKTLINEAIALEHTVNEENVVVIALREFIDRRKLKTEEKTRCSPKITQGDKTIDPIDLFGLWQEHPKQLEEIRQQAWHRFGLEK